MDTGKHSSSGGTSPSAKRAKIVTPTIGSQSFQGIVQSNAFVDKTMLIKEIVNSNDKVMLITCPRRFGKSTNMSMLKTFLEIEVNDEGKEVEDKSKTKNYKCFKNLEIAKDQDFMEEHFGKYPVIFVDFLNVKGGSYEEIFNKVKLTISVTFQQHVYMIDILDEISNNTNLKRSEKKRAQDFLNTFERMCDNKGQNATNIDVHDSLRFLSEILNNHFNKKVYVLIDEYDAPVHGAMQGEADVKEAQQLMDGVLCRVCKANDDYLERGILTGISEMVRAESSSGLNNVRKSQFLQNNHKFIKYYGFTSGEVSELLDKFRIEEDKRGQLEKWYNGYYAKGQNLNIYNPDAIIQYIEDRQLKSYWEQSGSIKNILGIFKAEAIREKIEQLIQDKDLEFTSRTKLDIGDVENLQSILNTKDEIKPQYIDLFFSYIFELGYLSPTQKENCYKIPNEEIKQEFKRNIVDYYLETYTLRRDDLKEAIKQLDLLLDNIQTNTSGFQQSLNKLFKPLELAKMSDAERHGIHTNEDLYHSIINVIALQSKGKKFGTEVQTEKISGKKGRIDIVLINDEVQLGIIIELKQLKKADAVKDALKQAKEYQPVFSSHTNIKQVKYIGINVDDNKNVTIAHELGDNPSYQNPSGEGLSSAQNNLYTLPYYKSFNEYHSDNIAEILQLRINKLSIDRKILILHDIEYQLTKSDTGAEKILRDLISLHLKDKEIILLPYNIENKHWVGLMVVKNNGELQVRYVDPENNTIPEVLLLDLQSKANELNMRINISHIIVEQQKYNNCGPEVIENFILLLTGSRLTQEDTVPFHSQLVEDDLLMHTDLSNCNVEILKDNSKMKY